MYLILILPIILLKYLLLIIPMILLKYLLITFFLSILQYLFLSTLPYSIPVFPVPMLYTHYSRTIAPIPYSYPIIAYFSLPPYLSPFPGRLLLTFVFPSNLYHYQSPALVSSFSHSQVSYSLPRPLPPSSSIFPFFLLFPCFTTCKFPLWKTLSF